MKRLFALVVVASSACSTFDFDSAPPSYYPAPPASRIIERPREAVWSAALLALKKRRYAIGDSDQKTGRIVISYQGNPEPHVDCGRIRTSSAKPPEVRYDFSAASASQKYLVRALDRWFIIERTMTLYGTVDLTLEGLGPERTRVTANTRYLLRREIRSQISGQGLINSVAHTISFDSKSGEAFPEWGPELIRCVPTGTLEAEVLAVFDQLR